LRPCEIGCGGTVIVEPPLDWIIVGGESGPGARPMHPDWARSIRDQCAAAGVAFFFKQWGAWCPGEVGATGRASAFGSMAPDGEFIRDTIVSVPPATLMLRFDKKANGRMLDGVDFNQFPRVTRNSAPAEPALA
jgi:protein gp37